MTDIYTPVIRALVVASLMLATATLMLVTLNTARAAGTLAIGSCGVFGEAFDFGTADETRHSAMSKCRGESCRVASIAKRGCAAFAVDFTNPRGANGWGNGPRRGVT
jgi:hypothetical protein